MQILNHINRWPRPRRTLAGVSFLILVGCLIYLTFGPKPWVSGIGPAEEAGIKLRTSHFRVSGMWWGAVANAILSILAIMLSRWLTSPLAEPKRVGFVFSIEDSPEEAPPKLKCWLSGSVLLAIIITLTGTLPRMDNGLWHDEDKSVRKFVVGQFVRSQASGEVNYRDITWEDTVFNGRLPNHTLFGILARLSHNTFPPEQDPTKPYLSEWALRLPSLIAGLAGLGMIAVALASLGFYRAAFLAPLLLAIHPWFLRYSSEARGYSLLFFFVPLCVYLLAKALRSARWKWWVMFGVAEFLTIYAVLNGAHFLVFLNLAALAWIFLSPGSGILFRRWLVSCGVAIFLGLLMMSPFLPQFQRYMKMTKGATGTYDRVQMKDNITSFAAGIRYEDFGENYAPSYKAMIEKTAVIPTGLLTLGVFGFAIAGAVRLSRSGSSGLALIAVCVLPAPFFYFHAWLTDAHIFYWYTIVGLPMFWALIAIGFGWIGKHKPMHITAALSPLLVLLIFVTTYPQRKFQLDRPIEFNRESVYLTRDILDPRDPGFDASLTININRHPMVYDGLAYKATTEEELLRWLEITDETNRPLYINHGAEVHLITATTTKEQRKKGQSSSFLDRIKDPKLFETIAELPGVDPGSDRTVKKYIPGSFKRKE